ncbi:hypothetical protein LXL04_029303 [Taraxacum kok-saghyz]
MILKLTQPLSAIRVGPIYGRDGPKPKASNHEGHHIPIGISIFSPRAINYYGPALSAMSMQVTYQTRIRNISNLVMSIPWGTRRYPVGLVSCLVSTSINHFELPALYDAARECIWLQVVVDHIRSTCDLAYDSDEPVVTPPLKLPQLLPPFIPVVPSSDQPSSDNQLRSDVYSARRIAGKLQRGCLLSPASLHSAGDQRSRDQPSDVQPSSLR